MIRSKAFNQSINQSPLPHLSLDFAAHWTKPNFQSTMLGDNLSRSTSSTMTVVISDILCSLAWRSPPTIYHFCTTQRGFCQNTWLDMGITFVHTYHTAYTYISTPGGGPYQQKAHQPLSRSSLWRLTVPCLVGVGVGLPSRADPRIVDPTERIGRMRVPTKPLRFLPVLPLPSQLSFNCLFSSSILICPSSPVCTEHNTLRHCNIRPTVSVTWALELSVGRAAGGLLND